MAFKLFICFKWDLLYEPFICMAMCHPEIRFDRICGLQDAEVEPLLVTEGKEGEKNKGDNSGYHCEDGFAGERDRYINQGDVQRIRLSLQENTFFTPFL